MARPAGHLVPDLSAARELTVGAIERLRCPAGKQQAFLRDSKAPGLRVRVTKAGAKAFVFEAKLDGRTLRTTIGDIRTWTIEQARVEARRLAVSVDSGQDPRVLDRQRQHAAAVARAQQAAQQVTLADAWELYRQDRKAHWSERHYLDHQRIIEQGGRQRKRRPQGVKTKPGVLAALAGVALVQLTAERVEHWVAQEAPMRPARVRLALRLLKAFLRWAAQDARLKGYVDATAASSKRAREDAGKPQLKLGALQREQLPVWFEQARLLRDPVMSAYLQCTLLTGRRREEMASVRWQDLDLQWNSINMKDKWLGRATIPLPPYMKQLLLALPRRNEWVFSSRTSKSGRLREPTYAHQRVCAAAGVNLSLHDLRRSFASLCEWLDIPGGVSAQIQGHAPQGVREQNYIRRPLDILRLHHERIEAWILQEAGIVFKGGAQPAKLHAVK